MSYLVLGLGGLLALGGAWALLTSYGIIMVERGWAGVIAGTTALGSGVVTIALGLVLYRLSSFFKLLKAGKGELPLRGLAEEENAEPSTAPHSVPKAAMVPETAPNSAAGPPVSGSRNWPQRQARPFHSPGRNVLKARGAAAPAALRTREPPPSPSNGNESAADLPSAPSLGPATPAETAAEGGIGPDMLARPALVDETHAEDRRTGKRGEPGLFQDEVQSEPLTATPFPEMPMPAGEVEIQPWPGSSWPAEPAMIETIVPAAEHITQQSVAEAGKERAEEPLPEVREEASLGPPPVTCDPGLGAHPKEPDVANERSSEHAITGDTLAIVGRYESEGASFVRYADGSIEARIDHAVFHFKSMAELKSFMELQAQTSQAQSPKE